jgi:uncharacterized membrane protein
VSTVIYVMYETSVSAVDPYMPRTKHPDQSRVPHRWILVVRVLLCFLLVRLAASPHRSSRPIAVRLDRCGCAVYERLYELGMPAV